MSPEEIDTAVRLKARIERCFQRIETERMAGIPILNRALRVEAVGLRRYADDWLGILVTPWFISAMLLPASAASEAGTEAADHQRAAVGSKSVARFPAGRFEMIHGREDDLGPFSMCSLFSPVLEFADHASAVIAAEAALAALLDSGTDEKGDADMDMIWRGELPIDRRAEPSRVADGEGVEDQGAVRACDAQPGSDDKEAHEDASLDRRSLLFGRTREAHKAPQDPKEREP